MNYDTEELQKCQELIDSRIAERINEGDPEDDYPYSENVFTSMVLEAMEEAGLTKEPVICRLDARVRRSSVRVSAYSIKETGGSGTALDLFVTIYHEGGTCQTIGRPDIRKFAESCLRFIELSRSREIFSALPQTDQDLLGLAHAIAGNYADFDKITIFLLTNDVATSTDFQDFDFDGKVIGVQVMDLRRVSRLILEGVRAEPINVNLRDRGVELPCLFNRTQDYEGVLTLIPGNLIYDLYKHYGARLLESNVRSWLAVRGKKSVNKGIQESVVNSPDMFFAYNNGLVITANRIEVGKNADGPCICSLEGIQVVNGGQTCATIYFTKRKNAVAALDKIFVPAKILVKSNESSISSEDFVSSISKFANRQNAIKESDLTSNISFLIDIEKASRSTWTPDSSSQWFFERAEGAYTTQGNREGESKSARRKNWKKAHPRNQKIKKTELAKYLSCWFGNPDWASLGDQKNFPLFLDRYVLDKEGDCRNIAITSDDWKRMVAVTILFRNIHAWCKKNFTAFQINMADYAVAVLAMKVADQINLKEIWINQGISQKLLNQAAAWIQEAASVMKRESQGKMLSEYCKKAECWEKVKKINFSPCRNDIPELQNPDAPFLGFEASA